MSAGRKAALLLALAVAGASCGGSGSGGGGGGGPAGPPTAAFAGSGTAAAADRVRLTGTANGDLVTLRVDLGGPTTSTDLFGFAFDLVLSNPSMIAVVSATEGDALTPATSVDVQIATQANRLIVGVSKLASATGGNGVGAGESTVVEIVLRATRAGTTTIAVDDPPGDSPAALDSNGQVVPSVQFDLAAATLQAN